MVSYGLALLMAAFITAKPLTATRLHLAHWNASGQAELSGVAQDDVSLLTPGQPIERELSAEAKHFYRVALDSRQYLRVRVEHWGIELGVAWYGPNGEVLAQFNGRQSGSMPISLIAETSGDYRLEVRSLEKGPVSGRYQVRIEEMRPATPKDEQRIAAEMLFAEGERLRAEWTVESRRKAIKKYEEARVLWRTVGDPVEEAGTRRIIGQIYQQLGDSKRALDSYEQALKLSQQATDRPGEADALTYLGSVRITLGEYEKALEHCTQALTLSRAVDHRRGEAETLNNIGEARYFKGERLEALDHYQQALPLWHAVGDRRGQAQTLLYLGEAYLDLGEIEKALDACDQALLRWRAVNDIQGQAHTLTAFGRLYNLLAEHQKALDFYYQAKPLFQPLGDHIGEARVLAGIGYAYDKFGEGRKAIRYYKEALRRFQAINSSDGQAAMFTRIGGAYYSLGDHWTAITYYRRALSIYRAMTTQWMESYVLRDMGLVYEAQGKKAKALNYYNRSLSLSQAGNDRRGEAYTLGDIGHVYDKLGKKKKALDYYNQASTLGRAMTDHGLEAQTLYRIARVERDLGNLTEARARIEAAAAIIETARAQIATQDLRTSYFGTARQHYDLYIDVLMRLHQRQPSDGHDITAFQTSEHAHARSLLELLTEAKKHIEQGIDPALRDRERMIQARITSIQNQLIQARSPASPDKDRIAALEQDLEKADSEREQLEMEIRQKHPRYAELQYPTPLDLSAVQGLLDDQTALLEYALGKDGSFLFVVGRDSLHSFRLPPVGRIIRDVKTIRAMLHQPPGPRLAQNQEFHTYTDAARQLYQVLMAPAATVLAKKRNLLIVPDGVLHYLPFECLLTQGVLPGSPTDYGRLAYVVNRWAVSYVPSASVLASLRENRPGQLASGPSKAFVAFADPVYKPSAKSTKQKVGGRAVNRTEESVSQNPLRGVWEKATGWAFHRLPNSNYEVTRIARRYKPEDVAVYVRHAASEETVKANEHLRTARRIHFATHGFIDERSPHFSGLVLTLDDDPKEDGLLQVFEIFNLKLNADLVVLSACETGLGKEVRGEGLIGLTRAFLYTGTPSVVVSLWQVMDRSTARLMVQFYEQLDLAGDKAEALRRAKQRMIQYKDGFYAHPYYWAPFILVGESR
jgi:CHAT domain-containing protein